MNSVTVNGKTYTKEFVAEKLATDPKWVQRAIIRLYERQTADEKQINHTKNVNGRGFNQSDAYMFSSFARQIQKGHTLTTGQLNYAWKKDVRGIPRISKYAGQMLQVMAENA